MNQVFRFVPTRIANPIVASSWQSPGSFMPGSLFLSAGRKLRFRRTRAMLAR
jgi:hypothetical protein